MGLAMVVGITVIIQTIVVPVGAALLQASGARETTGSLAAAVEDDVFKLEAASIEGGAAKTIVVHAIGTVKVVP